MTCASVGECTVFRELFFFKQKTAYEMRISDWSSDVCSSDLEFVVADDHAGLRAAIREVLTGAAYQRCYVHFLRNALDHLPRKADDDCLQELRWLYDRRNLAEARADLAQWLARWSAKYPR